MGRLIGGYRIGLLIKEGGFSIVCRAQREDLCGDRSGPAYAAKFLTAAQRLRADAVTRFVREYLILKALRHPNIVQVHELLYVDEVPCIVMDYLEGLDLEDHLQQAGGRLGVEDLLDLAQQACDALFVAHLHGVIHRDIKPGNIFICRTASGALAVRIIDFGIARAQQGQAQAQANDRCTGQGIFIGSPAYSPLEAFEGLALDVRADQYALGATFYRALTGRPPYSGSLRQIASAIMKRDPAPLSSLRPDLPPHISAAITRAMNRDRELRYPSMLEFLRALQGRHLAPQTIAVDLTDIDVLDEPERRTPRLPRLAWGLGALCLVLLGAYGASLRGTGAAAAPAAVAAPPPLEIRTVPVTSGPAPPTRETRENKKAAEPDRQDRPVGGKKRPEDKPRPRRRPDVLDKLL